MNSIQKNRAILEQFQYTFLKEAEEFFGPKTLYGYEEFTFKNHSPRVVRSENLFKKSIEGYQIILCAKGLIDLTDGIFQLSHEVVHLLSPVELKKDDEINFLEEGMSTWFSKYITERETGDAEFCMPAIERDERYVKAYNLYQQLIVIDQHAVKKMRDISPVICRIQPEDFKKAGLTLDEELIIALLGKFPEK
jgi:hypothetical protein